MSRRRKTEEEHVNHERWLVSYSDFITLLFALFVMLYAISSINEGKYRILSESLMAAFHQPTRSLQPIQVGKPTKGSVKSPQPVQTSAAVSGVHDLGFSLPIKGRSKTDARPEKRASQAMAETTAAPSPEELHMKLMADQIEKALQNLVDKKLVVVHHSPFWVEVRINSSVLFGSGSARLSDKARPVIAKVAKVLRKFPNRIQVEGFTDNVPISTPEFPTNWELSAGRAASVVHVLTGYDINPARLAATGYGQYHPIADNSTVGGRAENRRVVLVILAAGGDAKSRGDKAAGDRTVASLVPLPAPQVIQ